MKFLAIFFLAALAGCYGYQECLEEKANDCVEKLLLSIVDDSSKDEVCSELQSSIGCLGRVVEACPGAEDDQDLKEGIDNLKELLSDNCGADENGDVSSETEEEMTKCFEANEDYIFECMFEGTAAALEALDDVEDQDENALQCKLYGMLTTCFVDRINEKCGAEASQRAEKELSDLPEEIREACDAASGVGINLLDDDKRKKK